MLIDTHSHIYEPEFDDDREEVISRAREAGVGMMLLPAIDRASYSRMMCTAALCGEQCRVMIGLHPTSVNDNAQWREELRFVEEQLAAPPDGTLFCGVGEIGLDFYWSQDFRAEQTEAFERQVELALQYDLPIAVHTRAAWTEMTQIMARYSGRGLRGVFHAFSDTPETYLALSECGDFVFGIGGTATYKKSPLPQLLQHIPLDRIVLETDCPYLTPVPFRGRRNESSYVTYVRDCVAAAKGCTTAEVESATTENARRIFNL